MSSYEQIKLLLNEAGRHADAGNLAAADATIRAAIPYGLTAADITANLGRETVAKLRRWAKKNATA